MGAITQRCSSSGARPCDGIEDYIANKQLQDAANYNRMRMCYAGSHMTSAAARGRSRRPRTSSICLDSVIPLLLVGLWPECCWSVVWYHAGLPLAA